jgi:hypothetical protein
MGQPGSRTRFGRIARVSAAIYAIAAGLNGLFWTAFGLLWFFYAGGHLPAGVGLVLMLPGGLLFLLLSVFIWRGAPWAMIAVCLLVPLHWAIMLGPNPWVLLTHPANRFMDLSDLPYLFIGTALSVLLTILSIAGARYSRDS